MRRPIGPFLATGVAMVAAVAIVANPVMPPAADIRVSASDLSADGTPPDVLAPDFLESLHAAKPDWRNPVTMLGGLLDGLIKNRADDDDDTLIRTVRDLVGPAYPNRIDRGHTSPPHEWTVDSLPGAHGWGDAVQGVLDGSPDLSLPAILDVLPAPQQAAEGLIGALADIATSFGDAGTAFVSELGAAPAVVGDLAQQVRDGTLAADNALRQLVALPLRVAFDRDNDRIAERAIDSVFSGGILRLLLDALIRIVPAPIGQPDGWIDTVGRALTDATDTIRDALDRSAPPAPDDGPRLQGRPSSEPGPSYPRSGTSGAEKTTGTEDDNLSIDSGPKLIMSEKPGRGASFSVRSPRGDDATGRTKTAVDTATPTTTKPAPTAEPDDPSTPTADPSTDVAGDASDAPTRDDRSSASDDD